MQPKPNLLCFALVTVAAATAPFGPMGFAAEGEPEFGPARLLHEPGDGPTAEATLSPFQPVGVTTRLRRARLQFEALTADEAWEEAIELIERLQGEAREELTEASGEDLPPLEAPDKHERFVSVAEACESMLRSLPEGGLALYRARTSRSARERYTEAAAALDSTALERVVSEYPASEAATDALLTLGELALERGDVAAARQSLGRLHPLLRDPYGRPAGASLALIDPSVEPVRLADAWRSTVSERADDGATTANGLLPLALSRLAVASVLEGDLRRAAAETRLLQGLAPNAEGRIAGRTQTLADALGALIGARADTRSAAPAGGEVSYDWAWEAPVDVASTTLPTRVDRPAGVRINALGQIQRILKNPDPQPDPTPRPSLQPVADERRCFYVASGKLKQLDLASGETTTVNVPGVAPPEQDDKPRPNVGDIAANGVQVQRLANGQVQILRRPGGAGAQAVTQTYVGSGPLFHEGVLYVRVVRGVRNVVRRGLAQTNQETLVAMRLDAEPGDPPVRFSASGSVVEPGSPTPHFSGRPAVRGDRLYAAIERPGVQVDLAVACYSTTTGRRLWKTDLGSSEPRSRVIGTNGAATLVRGDTVYVSTNLGAVAALDAATGRTRWIARYPRDTQVVNLLDTEAPPESPCVLVGDQLIAAPADSNLLIAWDAGTGRPLWDAPRSADAAIAGIAPSESGATVVVAGRQVASYDTLTGARRFLWPESPRAGIRGRGAAAVVGDEVFWPTRDALYALDPMNGALTRPPIDLAPIGSAGANVVPTDAGLLLCGPERVRLLAAWRLSEAAEPTYGQSRSTSGRALAAAN